MSTSRKSWNGPVSRPSDHAWYRFIIGDCAAAKPGPIFHNVQYRTADCSRNIEMTPLCKVDVTLPEVRGALGLRDDGGVAEQEGIRSARSSAGRSVWPSACRRRLRTARPEAAAGLSVAGRFEA